MIQPLQFLYRLYDVFRLVIGLIWFSSVFESLFGFDMGLCEFGTCD